MKWNDYIEEDENDIKIDTDSRPQNEGEQHFFKKILLCQELADRGHETISIEDDENFQGIRFDILTKSPNGTTIGCEIGDFNCPSRKLKDRLERSYEAGVDVIFWWGKAPIVEKYMGIFDNLLMAENCPECISNTSWFNPMANFNFQLPSEYHNNAKIYMIDLKHLFEPKIWHQDNPEIAEEMN